MAFIDGKNQGSSVTRGLARHRMEKPADKSQMPPDQQQGKTMAVTHNGGDSFTTDDGMEHKGLESVKRHMAQHFGVPDNGAEVESQDEPMPMEHSGGGGLAAMGVNEG